MNIPLIQSVSFDDASFDDAATLVMGEAFDRACKSWRLDGLDVHSNLLSN